jgi:putative spermidine/putrescine transport system substrate-binding protein
MTTISLSRRTMTKMIATAVGVTILGAGAVSAQSNKRLVVGLWGGDYSRLVKKHIGDVVAKQGGFDVVYDEAAEPPRQTKIIAERQLPRGTTDVQALTNSLSGELVELNALEKIDPTKVPNAANLLPFLKNNISDYVAPQFYSGLVILYNPKLFPTAPSSFADLFKPGFREKLGFIDIQYMFNVFAASLAATGKPYEFEAAKKALLDLKATGVKIVPTNEAMAQALKSEEVGITVMWKARAVQWQNQGIEIKAVAPAEGVMLYVQGFGIPKNARNKDGAHEMLNAALSKESQEAFSVDFGYNPSVSNAQVSPELRERIGFNEEETKRLITPDADFFRRNNATTKDWWDKEFKG